MATFKLIFCEAHLIPFAIILLSTLCINYFITRKIISLFFGRKLLHFIAVSCCGLAIQLSPNVVLLSYLFGLFSLLLFGIIHTKLLAMQHNKSYGIMLFPLAFFIIIQSQLCNSSQILFGIYTLAIADVLGGIVGYYYGKPKIIFLAEPKSILGYSTFCIVCFAIYCIIFGTQYWHIAIVVALLTGCVELFSYKGSDNLTIPIFAPLFAIMVHNYSASLFYINAIAIAILILLGRLALYKKWLSITGVFAAVFVGTVVLFLQNYTHLIPLILFFAMGSLASACNHKKEKIERTALQVFANGTVAVSCLFIYYFTHNNAYYIAYFSSIAISLTDTISSELGKYYKHPTYDILTLQPTAVGLSGGISGIGTLAGVVFCVVFAITNYFIFSFSLLQVSTILLVGIVGMLTDSVLGSSLQAKYSTTNGTITEVETNNLVKGYTWCTNNMVNLLSNIIVIIVYIVVRLNF